MDFIEYCDQNRILLMVYPPHSTHTLQPLDVFMFKPFSSAYSGQVAAFIERCQGLTSMSKRDFYPMFVAAWEASFKKETILKAFQATGLSPFNPSSRMAPNSTQREEKSVLLTALQCIRTESNYRADAGHSILPRTSLMLRQ
jgi:hypothetical protein